MATPTILRWENLTKTAFDRIDRERAVVLVTCSPMEVHGPHLPLGTDAFEGDGLARRMVSHLDARHHERTFIQLPFIWVATDNVPQPGSIFFKAATIVAVLEDLGRSLAAQGFRHIWVSNFHASPRHFLAIEEACERVNRRTGPRMVPVFSLMLARLMGGRLDGDLQRAVEAVIGAIPGVDRADLGGDSHAGFIETAQLLALHPELVDPAFKDLPRATVEAWLAAQGHRPGGADGAGGGGGLGGLIRGARGDIRYYREGTYAGAPARATAEAGERILDAFAARCAEATGEILDGKASPLDAHSPLWRLRFLFLNSLLIGVTNRLLGHQPVC